MSANLEEKLSKQNQVHTSYGNVIMRNKLFCQNDYFDGVSVQRAETIFHQHEDRPLVGWVVDHQSADTEAILKTI